MVTTFFETGLGVSTYLVYIKAIPWMKSKSKLIEVPGGQKIDQMETYPWAKFLLKKILATDTMKRVPNRWWIRYLAFQALAFIIIFTVAEQVFMSAGWRNPFASSVTGQGLTMPGWLYDLAFARSNDQANGAHLVSYIGIPILGLYTIYKTRDMFMGLLMGAFFVAIHESIWETAYYIAYAQFLGWAEITNVLKDVSFSSMIILFIVTFWKYQDRKIPMKEFTPVVLIYSGMIASWFIVPSFFGYGFLPITTINNYSYGKGVYSETQFWGNPTVSLIEVFSWFGLYLMMQFVMLRWKPSELLNIY